MLLQNSTKSKKGLISADKTRIPVGGYTRALQDTLQVPRAKIILLQLQNTKTYNWKQKPRLNSHLGHFSTTLVPRHPHSLQKRDYGPGSMCKPWWRITPWLTYSTVQRGAPPSGMRAKRAKPTQSLRTVPEDQIRHAEGGPQWVAVKRCPALALRRACRYCWVAVASSRMLF